MARDTETRKKTGGNITIERRKQAEELQQLGREYDDAIKKCQEAEAALYHRIRELYEQGWSVQQLSQVVAISYGSLAWFLGEDRVLRQQKGKVGEDSVVYFIADQSDEKVKIGISNDVERRFAGLERSSPAPLSLLGTMRGGHKLEAEVHERFATMRLHGEWFELTPALRDYIEAHAEPVSAQPVPA